MAVYFTSDLHIGHKKEFVYLARGFESIEEHDEAILANWNATVSEKDEVYLLGDVMLNDKEYGLEILRKLNGHIHIIRGNHDTDEKIKKYAECDNVVEVVAAAYLRAGKNTLYLSHYPTLVSNRKQIQVNNIRANIYGHTHQKTNFFDDGVHGEHPYMYHVGVDSHNLRPVLLEEVIEEIRAKINEYAEMQQQDGEE